MTRNLLLVGILTSVMFATSVFAKDKSPMMKTISTIQITVKKSFTVDGFPSVATFKDGRIEPANKAYPFDKPRTICRFTPDYEYIKKNSISTGSAYMLKRTSGALDEDEATFEDPMPVPEGRMAELVCYPYMEPLTLATVRKALGDYFDLDVVDSAN